MSTLTHLKENKSRYFSHSIVGSSQWSYYCEEVDRYKGFRISHQVYTDRSGTPIFPNSFNDNYLQCNINDYVIFGNEFSGYVVEDRLFGRSKICEERKFRSSSIYECIDWAINTIDAIK